MSLTNHPRWIEFVPTWDEDDRVVEITLEPSPEPDRRSPWPRLLGWVMAAVGGIGIAIGVGIAVVGLVLVNDASTAVSGGLAIARDTIDNVDDSIDTARRSIGDAAESLRRVERSLDDAGSALTRSDTALADTSEVIGNDLAESIDSLVDSLPGLIDVGDTLDATLRSLALFGVPYDPEASIGDGFREMLSSLDQVPERLRTQGDLVDDLRTDLVVTAENVGRVRLGITDIRNRLDDVLLLLDDYGTTTADARSYIDDLDATIQARASTIRWATIATGLFVACFQVVPLFLAWLLLRRRRGAPERVT